MGRAEVGSTKYLSNKLKSKGLQRLRWYCQVCGKQCRDENGFKMHTQSESHVRQMLIVGDNPKKYIDQYSNEFLNDFIALLRTSKSTASVSLNRFYQDYIANKEHVHMNATRWSSLTEFAKYLGKEGICRVEDLEDKGLHIAWIDNSPEALKRAEALRKKERMDKGDEERERELIEAQIKRAEAQKKSREQGLGNGANAHSERSEEDVGEEDNGKEQGLKRDEGQKIVLAFGAKSAKSAPEPLKMQGIETASQGNDHTASKMSLTTPTSKVIVSTNSKAESKIKPLNVFKKAAKKPSTNTNSKGSTDLSDSSKRDEPTKKMSEVERIMREELARKRPLETAPGVGFKFDTSSKNPHKRHRPT